MSYEMIGYFEDNNLNPGDKVMILENSNSLMEVVVGKVYTLDSSGGTPVIIDDMGNSWNGYSLKYRIAGHPGQLKGIAKFLKDKGL